MFAGLTIGIAVAPSVAAQVVPPFVISPNPATATPILRQPKKLRVTPPYPIEKNELVIFGRTQMKEGSWYRLRGQSVVETETFLLKADDIDYNEDTGDVDARGSVYLQHFAGGEELWCDHAQYNIDDETGKFYDVRGQALTHIESRPRVLTSSNPFYFQGEWAERIKEKYILHNGFVTNCKMPKPWWTVHAPIFDIMPGDRAISHRSVFRFRRIPLFYTPYYYKSLEKLPRQSGFLTPNVGNSSVRGRMIGAGYYWAINPSYDAAYRAQFFTQGALAHNFDFRGKPNESSDFNVALFGVQDPGTQTGNTTTKEGGFTLTAQGRSDLGDGFYARGELNYLSSLLFRQSFTQSYSEAISSEVHSIGFITKQWSTYGLDLVAQRSQDYLSTTPGDNIAIRKLPEVEFTSRDRRIVDNFPVWVSWQMSGGLMERTEPDLQTRSSVGRLEIYPEITTVLRWKDFALVPSFAVRETYYDESLNNQFHIAGQNVATGGREVNLQFVLPSFARVYDGPKWLGDKIKHVIEPGADYHYVTGVNNFNNVLRFDEMDVFSNTNEVEVWVTNRLYTKRKDKVEEILSWDLRQKRYFDPTFGGAVSNWCGQTACRNIVLSEMELTPYAFLDGPRNYSPIVSTLRMSPKPGFGIEWRSDYDPLRHNFVASSATIDIHHGIYGFSFGQNSLKAVPALIPNSNQLRGQFTIGNDNRRGWNAGFQAVYDYRLQQLQFANTQVTYNTDCCGFTFGFRRLSYGIRNENQFQVSFSVANVGAFGTLKKQDRMF